MVIRFFEVYFFHLAHCNVVLGPRIAVSGLVVWFY